MADITGIDLSGLSSTALQALSNRYSSVGKSSTFINEDEDFSKVLSSAMNLISETNELSNEAEAKEIDFALGNIDSIHEVTVAQQKAYVSLQYTVAIKNALLSAYKEILNIQV